MSVDVDEIATAEDNDDGEHEIMPVCGWCAEPLVADYDGEFWHKAEFDAKEAAYLASLPKLPDTPEPEVLMSPHGQGQSQEELRRRAFKAFGLKDPHDA